MVEDSLRESQAGQHIKDAEYFVEGQIVSYEYFYANDGKTIYTKLMVSVTADYLSNIETDSIYLIVPGGAIGLDVQFEEHSAIPPLHEGRTYFLLMKLNEYQVSPLLPGNLNLFNLIIVGNKCPIGTYSTHTRNEKGTVIFNGVKYKSRNEFNEFAFKIVGESRYKKKVVLE